MGVYSRQPLATGKGVSGDAESEGSQRQNPDSRNTNIIQGSSHRTSLHNKTKSESYAGVQTFVGITENNLMEVRFGGDDLMEQIVSPANLNRAYKQVVSNRGSGGVDRMPTGDLLPWLYLHRESLINSLLDGSCRPNPVRWVEIPKGNGQPRPLGIPTVVDRLVQQSISQVLTPLYEAKFSETSYGSRPKRAAERTRESIIRFIEDKLHLQVNREKTKVGYVRGMKFLGYSFYIHSGECRLSVHPFCHP